jgi:hypothetical protein
MRIARPHNEKVSHGFMLSSVFALQKSGSRMVAGPQTRAAALVPAELENRVLRQALLENLISFPSQVPVFEKQSRPDLQQKLVVLYFVRGWTMDDIAQRYGLARQRMGQILTAWRVRAVQQGYIQAIQPEHPLFSRVRLEQVSQFAEMAASAESREHSAPIPSSEEEPLPALPRLAELGRSNLVEELHAIVGILDNQLRLCSKPLNGNLDSCELLLARAKAICAQLEAHFVAEEDWQPRAVISAAKELFERFQAHAAKRSNRQPKPMFGTSAIQVRPLSPSGNRRNTAPRTGRRVSVSVGLKHGQLSHEREVNFRGSADGPTPPAP